MIILVGELHGTYEGPLACMNILKEHKAKHLALEFDTSKQYEIDEYYSGKRALEDLSIFHIPKPYDGRSSSAVKELVIKARKQNIMIHFVDVEEGSDIHKRDETMAKNLMSIKHDVVFLCGNIHASKTPITFSKTFLILNRVLQLFRKGIILPRNGTLKTCGAYLPFDKTFSYKIVALRGGSYYNFKVRKIRGEKFLENRASKVPAIIPSKERGYDYFYIVDRFTPTE